MELGASVVLSGGAARSGEVIGAGLAMETGAKTLRDRAAAFLNEMIKRSPTKSSGTSFCLCRSLPARA